MTEHLRNDLLLSDASVAGKVFQFNSNFENCNPLSTLQSEITFKTLPFESTCEQSTFVKKSIEREDNVSEFSLDPWKKKPGQNQENDEEIQRIIALKMSKLDMFNDLSMTKREKNIYSKYNLNQKKLQSIVKCQRIIRSFLMRKKFMKALRMNDYIENKQNCMELGKSLKRHKRKIIEQQSHTKDGILDYLL